MQRTDYELLQLGIVWKWSSCGDQQVVRNNAAGVLCATAAATTTQAARGSLISQTTRIVINLPLQVFAPGCPDIYWTINNVLSGSFPPNLG